MRYLVSALWVLGLAGVTVAAAGSADGQYAFAESLLGEGEEQFALLEFRRFVHEYPTDVRVPDAQLSVAVVILTLRGDVAASRAALVALTDNYPGTDAAEKAQGLTDFYDAHGDVEGRPLVAYFKAQAAQRQGTAEQGANLFLSAAEEWPQSTLGDRLLLGGAKVQLHELGKPKEALKNLQLLVNRYPESSRVPEAQFEAALAVKALKGADSPEAVAVLQKVAEANKDNEFGTRALEELAALRNEAVPFERKSDVSLVKEFRVLQEGYDDKDRYVLIIQIPTDATEAQVQATLEDALLKAAAKRTKEEHSARVDGFFNYPVTEAGKARWTPGQEPKYEVEKRKTEDLLKDTLFDILRNR